MWLVVEVVHANTTNILVSCFFTSPSVLSSSTQELQDEHRDSATRRRERGVSCYYRSGDRA
ncbi:unnamed protein product, partial [Amoebophrya sp. A25]|eukprot:GSA25T00006152001.1